MVPSLEYLVFSTRIYTKIYYKMGQKTGLFLRIDHFAMVNGKTACDVKSFKILSKKV